MQNEKICMASAWLTHKFVAIRRIPIVLPEPQAAQLAYRHPHAWLKRLDKKAVALGDGKRMLVKGGKFNKTYRITVPEEMNAVS